MGADYIPERDIRACCWMKRFARVLVESPEAYRMTADDAAEIDAVVLAFRTANAQCWPSFIRTRVLARTKNDARKAAEQLVRPAAQRIRTDPRIASDLKVTIGLKPKTKRRGRIPTPQSQPMLNLSGAMSGLVTIRVSDSISHRRGRPKESRGLELYERIRPRAVVDAARLVKTSDANDPAQLNLADGSNPSATEPAADTVTETWRFIGIYTRSPIQLYPPLVVYGDEATYVARWITQRGEPAAFGRPVSIRPWLSLLRRSGLATQRDRRAAA